MWATNLRFEFQNKRDHEAEDCVGWRRDEGEARKMGDYGTFTRGWGNVQDFDCATVHIKSGNMCFAKSGTLQGAGWTHMVIKHLPQSAVAKRERGSHQLTLPNTTLFHLTAILMKPLNRTKHQINRVGKLFRDYWLYLSSVFPLPCSVFYVA